MLCNDCKNREATYHEVTEINGYRTDVHLCSECAKKRKVGVRSESLFDSLLGGFGFSSLVSPRNSSVCSKCGHTFQEYYETGLLGCSACYDEFASYVLPALRNSQNKVMHIGKKPGAKSKVYKNPEYDKLKSLLARYVEEEEYDKAAEVQEKIRALDKGEN